MNLREPVQLSLFPETVLIGVIGHVGFDKGGLAAAVAAIGAKTVIVEEVSTNHQQFVVIRDNRAQLAAPMIASDDKRRRSKGDRHRDPKWRRR
jgi:hypothetical protein